MPESDTTPAVTPPNEITIFGETNFRNLRKSFGIKRDDRRRHVYIIGKTGMGKTTLLENMIISDIINGEGCCYVDPHGDTAEKILDFIPANRINDLVYLNPADTEYPIAFNVLEAVDEKDKNLIASGLISVFKKLWADSWGPRLEYILRNAILALLDYPGSTLLGIMRILVDKEYREKVMDKIKDPVVKSFWINEYAKWNDRVLQEVISPIQNKVGQFLSNFIIRNIVGQVKSTINLREIMDQKKILVLNLAKGRIGEDTMQLLGSMIVTKLYLAAMSRVDVPEKERSDFYLYVDEFQNFATESFADILSEARKYRLNLVVAHQYIEQLPEIVASAVFGNVGTLVCFRVGAGDAELLVREFTPLYTEEDLVNLPAFNIYLKLMIDGISSDPFSAATLPPLFEDLRTENRDKVIKVSRERYAHPRAVVEDKINRWSGMDLSEKVVETMGSEAAPSRAGDRSRDFRKQEMGRTDRERPREDRRDVRRDDRRDDGQREKPKSFSPPRDNRPAPLERKREEGRFAAECSLCGKPFKLGFEPDPSRPVYCEDCLKKVREERRKKKDQRAPEIKMLNDLVEPEELKSAKPISLAAALGKQPVSFVPNKAAPAPKPRIETDMQGKNEEAAEAKAAVKPADQPLKPAAGNNTGQNQTRTSRPADLDRPADDFNPNDVKIEWYEQAKKQYLKDAKDANTSNQDNASRDIKPGQVIKMD